METLLLHVETKAGYFRGPGGVQTVVWIRLYLFDRCTGTAAEWISEPVLEGHHWCEARVRFKAEQCRSTPKIWTLVFFFVISLAH